MEADALRTLVRISVLLCVLLVWVAQRFELDILLGAFAAGMVARPFLVGHATEETSDGPEHHEEVQHRLEALGFGFFIPLFFVVSGVHFDLASLGNAAALAKLRCSSGCSYWSAVCPHCSIARICLATTWSHSVSCNRPRCRC